MKTFISILLALMSLQAFAIPASDSLSVEEMYGAFDKDGKYRAMEEQVEQIIQKSEEAKQEKAAQQRLAMWIAILIGLVPFGVIVAQVIKGRTWRDNPGGTAKALAIGIAGATVLAGLNYGIFLLKIEYGSKFNTAVVVAFVLFLVAGSIYLLKKK